MGSGTPFVDSLHFIPTSQFLIFFNFFIIIFLYVVEQPSLRLGVLPLAPSILAVPLVSPQTTQDSFSFPSLLMSSSVVTPSVATAASHLPISASSVLGHPSPLSLLLPVSSLASVPPTQMSLRLSLSSEPILSRLVHRIWSGQFVEMQDLLGDNIALNQHSEAVNSYFPAHILPASSHPHLRKCLLCPLGYIVFDISGCGHSRPVYP